MADVSIPKKVRTVKFLPALLLVIDICIVSDLQFCKLSW